MREMESTVGGLSLAAVPHHPVVKVVCVGAPVWSLLDAWI